MQEEYICFGNREEDAKYQKKFTVNFQLSFPEWDMSGIEHHTPYTDVILTDAMEACNRLPDKQRLRLYDTVRASLDVVLTADPTTESWNWTSHPFGRAFTEVYQKILDEPDLPLNQPIELPSFNLCKFEVRILELEIDG